jgi:hypothetical protein
MSWGIWVISAISLTSSSSVDARSSNSRIPISANFLASSFVKLLIFVRSTASSLTIFSATSLAGFSTFSGLGSSLVSGLGAALGLGFILPVSIPASSIQSCSDFAYS